MRTKNVWIYADNFILNGVKGNYTKALAVSTHHFAALTSQQSNPAIAALLDTYTPIHEALINATSAKNGSVGTRMSKTQTTNELFAKLIRTDLPLWVQMIGNVYPRRSAKFKGLFPHGLTAFHRGSAEIKIERLALLRKKCLASIPLAPVGALIDTFYNALLTAKGKQNGEKSTVKGNIGTQKKAIEAMCVAHFSNHGVIVSLFPKNPKKIKAFTDVQTLKNHVHSDVYEGIVHADKIRKVATKKVTAESKIKVSADVDIQIWVIDSKNNERHPEGVFVPANAQVELSVLDLGNPAHRVFQLKNLNLTTSGNYSVEFL